MKQIHGYMAITAAIIISVVMMLVGLSISFTALFGRSNQLSATMKQRSLFAAHGCLDYALLQLSLSSTYSGNEILQIPTGNEIFSCTIQPITTQGVNKIIQTRATVNSTTSNLELTVASSTLTRVSLREVTSF